MNKIRPNASVKYSYGNDGRDGHFYVSYTCPHCNERINKKDIACAKCGVFFDWSKQAHIHVERTVEWE